MNEFWLIASILSFIAFGIFTILPAKETEIINFGFDSGAELDTFEKESIDITVIIFRVLSFIMTITFLLLYFL